MDAYEREEQIIEKQHEDGEIDDKEYYRQMRDLNREFEEAEALEHRRWNP